MKFGKKKLWEGMGKTKVIRNTAFYTIGSVLPKLLNFILLPILTLYLSPTDYGIISYTYSLVTFLYVIILLSLNTFLIRHYFDCKTEEERKKLFGNVFLFITVSNIILTGLVFLLGPLIFKEFDLQIPFFPYVYLALINNSLMIFATIPLIHFRVKEEAFKFSLLSFSHSFLNIGLVAILIVFANMGVLGHYYGRLIGNTIFLFIYLYIIFKNSIFVVNIKQIKYMLAFSLPLVLGALSNIIIRFLDRILLERFGSINDIGIYSVAYTISFSISLILVGLYKAVEPTVYREYNNPDFATKFLNIKTYLIYIFSIIAFSLALFGREILTIMASDKFVNAYLYIPILVLAALMSGAVALFATLSVAEKKTRLNSKATIAGAFSSIILNLVFIRYWGFYAAAITNVVAFFIIISIILKGINMKVTGLFKDIFVLVIGIIITFPIIYLFNHDSLFLTFIVKISGLVFYSYLAAILYGINLFEILMKFKTIVSNK